MTAPAKKAAPKPGPKSSAGTGAAEKAIGKSATKGKEDKPTGPRYTRKSYVAKEGFKLYEATGRAGKINVRQFDQVMTHAADVQDTAHPNADWHDGVITRFFPSKEKADDYKAKKEAEADTVNVKIVAAQPYKGQGE
jgi:hypothetical protein